MAEEEENQEEEKGGASTMKIVIIAVVAAVLLSGGMAGGAMYFMGVFDAKLEVTAQAEGEDDEAEVEEIPKGPPQYHSMDPKFVISFREQQSARFMQFSLQLMTRDNDIMKQIDAHMPAIRSNLLLLFGQQQYDDMVTRKGKEQLLKDVATDVNNTLAMLNDGEAPETGVEIAYFDSFVIP